ncbi:MAG: site-specific DNA-methyltransferase [Xanthomonadales bacterium]|nr:site-specific DNA-methyltransferase [Xanthomonadales bacterium]
MPTLNWIGKEAVVKHHKDVPFRLLEPVEELSAGDADSGNLIIQGDNLDALKALLPRYAGQVKCIYIDPPYNTGNEGWVYNDNVNSPEIRRWLGEVVGKEGETLDRHDRWLCMMYPRLLLLKQFLRNDGVIWISIDDAAVTLLRILMNEIFGNEKFIACNVWQKRYSRENREAIGDVHEYIVVYAMNPALFKASRHKIPINEKQAKVYRNPNNDPKGRWRPIPMTAQAGHATPDQFYEIIAPSGKSFRPPKGRCWGFAKATFEKLRSDGKVYFGKTGNSQPNTIRYLSEVEGVVPWTWWPHDEVGNTDEATKELMGIFGGESPFNTSPKPSRLIERILQISTDKDSLILDSFAGSGTTAHALLKKNAEDGGARRFILIEMDKVVSKNITAERIKRVAYGYTNFKGKEIPGLGSGFQFCRLSSKPLFTADGQIRRDVSFAQLAEFVWFVETGSGYSGSGNSPLLGVHEGRAIYLLYNGILKDKSVAGGNVLTGPTFDTLPAFAGPKTIFAAACRMGARLSREGIVFKQTPYALDV